jgi:broad specificity phosphatase PhoE
MRLNNLPPLYFIRHGETDWNKQGIIQGSQGIDLNATGVGQAQAVAQALLARAEELQYFDFVVSPQLRAQHTMRIIAETLGRDLAAVRTDKRLRELEFGVWEGRPFWELKASPIYPADPEAHYEWRADGGESYADGVARVDDFLSEVSKPTLIVAHGAIGRCLIGFVAGLAPTAICHLPTPQGCYCRLENGTYSWIDATV